jgi:DNA-binding beta-propeller fold protein YncE
MTTPATPTPHSPLVYTLVEEFPSATGGLAIDSQGNLYAANIGRAPARNGSEIYRITTDGEVSLWISDENLRGASGNTFDSSGNLYQSSLRSNKIYRISVTGELTPFASEGISGPVGIAAGQDGSLFVANCRGASIQRIGPDGSSSRFAVSALFACPNGITLDDAGNVYVANFSNGDVLRVGADGGVELFVEIPGGNNGHILYHDGLLYAVSRGGNQVYTISLEGELKLLAGTGERGHLDGPAEEATFSLPNDIVVSPDGKKLYVNEVVPTSGSENLPSRIRVIELQ